MNTTYQRIKQRRVEIGRELDTACKQLYPGLMYPHYIYKAERNGLISWTEFLAIQEYHASHEEYYR